MRRFLSSTRYSCYSSPFLYFIIATTILSITVHAGQLSSSRHHLNTLSKIAPILGESAIIDKETGQVFWQGGKQNLFDSTIGHSYLSTQEEGVLQHMRATLFTIILWTSFIRYIAKWTLNQKIIIHFTQQMQHPSQQILNAVKILTRAFLFCLACFPDFGRVFLGLVVIMYLLESYSSSTRQYLANAMDCPTDVEQFLEDLRDQPPCVQWKIRCYHYEERTWLRILLLKDLWKYMSNLIHGSDAENDCHDDEILGPSIFTRKVVTHQNETNYNVSQFHDDTVGGLWKQAMASITVMTAFTKISLYKLLLFADKKTRVDYFRQQSRFIHQEGVKDEYAEFSTHVDVKGYKGKVLAVRQPHGVQKIFNIRYYWLFTLLGLTVPYRIKFGKYCDELRVAVVKEVSLPKVEEKTSKKSSWFLPSWLWGPETKEDEVHLRRETFKQRMQDISLYGNKDIRNTTVDSMDEIDKETIEEYMDEAILNIENKTNETTDLSVPEDEDINIHSEGDKDSSE
ncbi:hypothetical protein CTEN210_04153 [Chaetoceros tenuissimus]|uniref:Uncharacterized protein n=1 Tax=Chaetoceros tenuissimus TaxID=426638 RepID=A0AAD3CKN9_9STRA|nr:hypothetical protein CTEN210_04153 [Chaetoceros tenuissimus]